MFDADALPPSIVPAVHAFATALTAHVRTQRNASLTAHEQGLLEVWRVHAPALLTQVLQASTEGLTTPGHPARCLHAACPTCQRRQRPQRRSGRARTVLTRLGRVTLTRPWHHCRRCQTGWSPVDRVLGLAPRQRTSSGMQPWEATLGGRLPCAESRRVLVELRSVSVGTETLRTPAERVGGQAEAVEQATIAPVRATQDPHPSSTRRPPSNW